MLKISANDTQLTVVSCVPITSDSIGVPCEITLSPEYDGLAVTLVFKAGDVQRDVALLGSPVHVPAECLEQAGEVLMVGIWAGDGSGIPTIRTVWTSAGIIREGVMSSGIDPSTPEPDWAAQVQQAAANAVATANSVRADADAGVFDGEDGYSPTATVTQDDGSATITITDKDGTTTATVHDGADGRDGRDGTDGVDGFSPTATVTQTAAGATISITDKSGTTTASVSNGTDGADGTDGFSPTVDVQPITGGHEVTITDADGAHSFDVMDGDPAAPGSITDAMLAPDGIKPQVAQLFGNQLTGELSGTIDTAADAYAAPPMALVVDGASTQAGTPTPDAPVPILSVDDLSLVLARKNLFDVDNAFLLNGYFDSGGHIRPNANFRTVAIKVVPSTTYALQMTRFTSLSAAGLSMWLFSETPETSTSGVHGTRAITFYLPTTVSGGYHYEGQITTDADTKYICISVGNTTDYDVPASLATLQLEAGSTATAYEPYQGQSIPLYDGILRSLPDGTKDQLHLSYLRPSTRAGWAWYGREVTRNVHLMTLDGTETWGHDAHGYYYGINELYSPVGDYTQSLLCDCLMAYSNYSTLDNVDGISAYRVTGTGANWVYVNVQGVTTVANFKAWLAEHLPLVMYASRATPTTETLPEIELPELPAPNCTVWCDGGSAQPTFQMEYVQDTNIVIAELRAALADLATS